MNRLSATLIAILGAAGCSGSDFDAPPTHPVSGTITFEGLPVEGAVVQFVPSLNTGGPTPASGKTDVAGKYTLHTAFTPSVEEQGAMAGDYAVVVQKVNLPPAIEPESPPEGLSPKEQSEFMAKQAMELRNRQSSQPPPESELPAKYGNKQTTTLEATVPEGGGTFDFNLTDD